MSVLLSRLPSNMLLAILQKTSGEAFSRLYSTCSWLHDWIRRNIRLFAISVTYKSLIILHIPGKEFHCLVVADGLNRFEDVDMFREPGIDIRTTVGFRFHKIHLCWDEFGLPQGVSGRQEAVKALNSSLLLLFSEISRLHCDYLVLTGSLAPNVADHILKKIVFTNLDGQPFHAYYLDCKQIQKCKDVHLFNDRNGVSICGGYSKTDNELWKALASEGDGGNWRKVDVFFVEFVRNLLHSADPPETVEIFCDQYGDYSFRPPENWKLIYCGSEPKPRKSIYFLQSSRKWHFITVFYSIRARRKRLAIDSVPRGDVGGLLVALSASMAHRNPVDLSEIAASTQERLGEEEAVRNAFRLFHAAICSSAGCSLC